jgi:hypothetical protein
MLKVVKKGFMKLRQLCCLTLYDDIIAIRTLDTVKTRHNVKFIQSGSFFNFWNVKYKID